LSAIDEGGSGLSSTATEERGVSVGAGAPAPIKVLFFLSSIDQCRVFERLLHAMLSAGHRVLVALEHQTGGLAGDGTHLLEQLRERYEAFDYQQLPPRRGPWRIPASAVRRSLDYLRYLQPEYEEGDPRREQARERAPRLLRALLFLPPFRWGSGRRPLGWLLRRLEAGMPIPRDVRDFISEQASAVVLVSPLVDFGSAQGDYLRTAEEAGIPSVLLVAGGDDLGSKGLIRDVPTLTVTWNDAQVDEAVRFHGLPRERLVVVGAEGYDGTASPAAASSVQAIERVAPTEVPRRSEGRVLRPLLWLATPLLLLLLPLLRPRATGRDLFRALRRLVRRSRKRAKALRRSIGRKRAERRRTRVEAARGQRKALAGAREQEKTRAAAAREEKARTAAAKQEENARTAAAREEKARTAAAKEEKRARAEAKQLAKEEAAAAASERDEAAFEAEELDEAADDASEKRKAQPG
jgi:hypothetical protein